MTMIQSTGYNICKPGSQTKNGGVLQTILTYQGNDANFPVVVGARAALERGLHA